MYGTNENILDIYDLKYNFTDKRLVSLRLNNKQARTERDMINFWRVYVSKNQAVLSRFKFSF